MKNIIITDAKYRSSLAAVYSLAGKEYNIILCQTDDYKKTPLSFSSKYASKTVFLSERNYSEELESLIRMYDRPVIIPIGANTTELLSRERAKFSEICDFLVPSTEALDAANDKKTVADTARRLGIPVPEEITEEPETYPVIIKPSCGEKFGLHAEERYIRADSRDEYIAAMEKMKKYDPSPIVQEYIQGDAVGVCLLISPNGCTAGTVCHKRIRELPVTGGPSTCCETINDDKLFNYSCQLLKELNFQGVAMVEFKNGRLLEINPRVWGSFPLTYHCRSNFTENWIRCAAGEKFEAPEYKKNVKMNFIVNDTVAAFKYLSHGKFSKFFGAVKDILNPCVKEALFSFNDPLPFFTYIKNLF
ncbi:MAG: ATP-grasp domain-containing protein [Ruminococcaceae bacterium]|nr:ATP-grasp domain-containing protein [Oscillospiraceae bacterium]